MSGNSLQSNTWSSALKNESFRKNFILSIFLLAIVLVLFFFTLQYVEQRKGFLIEKGWLDKICSPEDFSNWIFSFTYGAILTGLIFCFRNPQTTLLLVRTYLLLQLFRTICLLLCPLDPPQGIIPLNDPFLHATFYSGRPNVKDLFFSGHVATLVMFIPLMKNKFLKIFFILISILAGSLLALQHVHYIVDILAAPVFAFLAFFLAKRWSSNFLLPRD